MTIHRPYTNKEITTNIEGAAIETLEEIESAQKENGLIDNEWKL